MAASKLALRKLELRGSFSIRKAGCNNHAIGISLLLACSAAIFLLCFMYDDVRTFYGGSSSSEEAVVLQSGLGTTSMNSYGSEEGTVSRPLTEISPSEVDLENAVEERKKSVEALESTGASNDSSIVEESDDSGLNDDSIRSGTPKDKLSQSEVLEMPVGADTTSTDRKSLSGCDISQGKWVYDETYPLYRSKNCPFADPGFRCEENGRPDKDFMKYRWQPHDCDLPRFNPQDMLERLRDQRVVFVGDSLGRNQWESMLCMLAEGVQNKSRIYEINGETISKHVGELIFRFQDYNCTVEYYRDPFLVPQTRPPPHSPSNVTSSLKIDQVSWSAGRWPGANILVFNSGHWWSWEKINRGGGRFQVGNNLTTHGFKEAFHIALNTWASWMEENIDPATTQVFFRSYASVHFRGGSWNSGGHCHEEVKPLTDEDVQKMQKTPWTNKLIVDAINKNIKKKRSVVEFMDVTTSTDYRSDGHSGLYANDVKVMGPTPMNRQDCSHFCLPGVPDTWNELLYATLLARGHGVWGEPIRY
ncbi:hypothetical protein M758_10G027600 [Ceratodon purpureus]|uniref:Trichome birefringence-like N-terminal domain-containing protein n=1 Tax=Ceratodon purpureus TaxID=3225 RepID=A0A8T0GHE5_CERPU|nr:hypothetical protein KC19_10G029200 [Ceratodon purpureus]KAG0602618.1 hypothetical protein M758_10G027600 [Ceratodon purpureus]